MQTGANSQNSTLRFAAGHCSERYPLPVQGALDWQRGASANRWQASVELEALTVGELLLPSVALLTSMHYAVRCSLTADGQTWWLTALSTDPAAANFVDCSASENHTTQTVTTHLDLFAIHQPLAKATLMIELVCETRPEDYLCVISRRQQNLSGPQLQQVPQSSYPEVKAPNISQMVQPSEQCSRTCSPTSLSMLMGHHGAAYHPVFVDQCKEPSSGLYGVWPLNIMQASRRDFVAAAELVSDWATLAGVQYPFVASIRFDPDQLTGAPLEQTAGHLVLVRGCTAATVICSDPAAPTASTVERSYDLAQFTRAWLGFRGATYIAVPREVAAEAQQTS